MKKVIWPVSIVLIIIAAIYVVILTSKNNVSNLSQTPVPLSLIDPNNLTEIQTGNTPWQVETSGLKERLMAIGLPALSSEGTVLHIHQHIDIFVDGNPVTIPADIGINSDQNFLSPIHTHDTTGVVHVESPVNQTFYLGQFFDIWGVRLTNDCLGGYCNGGGKTLKIFNNGKEVTGDFAGLVLTAHQEIVISYGTEKELPSPIPDSYNFPQGD